MDEIPSFIKPMTIDEPTAGHNFGNAEGEADPPLGVADDMIHFLRLCG